MTNEERGEIAYQLTKRLVIDISTARAAVDAAALVGQPSGRPAPAGQAVGAMLAKADIDDLLRLEAIFSDGEGWDLPKARMQRLAEIGALRHSGGGRYSFTSFGQWCIGSWRALPLETVEEANERSRREMEARNVILAASQAERPASLHSWLTNFREAEKREPTPVEIWCAAIDCVSPPAPAGQAVGELRAAIFNALAEARTIGHVKAKGYETDKAQRAYDAALERLEAALASLAEPGGKS